METQENLFEKSLKSIISDKTKLVSFVLSALALICSLMYLFTSRINGIHLAYMITLFVAIITNIIFLVDHKCENKYALNAFVAGIAIFLIGLILKVVQVGITFSIVYLIGYSLYAFVFLFLGLYCTKNQINTKLIKVLLLVCAAWSLFEFIQLCSVEISGVIWKIFRLTECFAALAYFCTLCVIKKRDFVFADKVAGYKKQIPSSKCCIIILAIIVAVSALVGVVFEIDRNSKTTVKKESTVTQAETQDKTKTDTVSKTETPKKSTVTSTVIPSEEQSKEEKLIKLGDTVDTEYFTFKLNKVEISRRVEPDNPPRFYTYYDAEGDNTYIYINASVKNKDKNSLECDEIYSVTAYYDSGYKYTGFNICDDYDGDFTYANITSISPLETLGVHCLVECPKQIENDDKPLYLLIKLDDGSEYKYVIR